MLLFQCRTKQLAVRARLMTATNTTNNNAEIYHKQKSRIGFPISIKSEHDLVHHSTEKAWENLTRIISL